MFRKFWRHSWPFLLTLAVVAVCLGVGRGEYTSVNKWAHTLCTSCIGLGR